MRWAHARTADPRAPVLLERLRQELDEPTLEYRRAPSPLRGGKFSSVLAFELDRAPGDGTSAFVLRLFGHAAEQARLEAGLHRAARGPGLHAPRILMWEPDGADIGEAYLVMERLPGRTYLRGVEPWRFAIDLPKLVRSWPRHLAGVINALARVDADDARRALEQHGVPDHLTQPGRHFRSVSTVLADEPTLHGVIDWLRAHRPEPRRLALVHGDLWPGNVFLRHSEVGLVDWTRGGVDDPALDVGFAKIGFALMPEPFPPPAPIRQLVHDVGTSIAMRISSHCDQLVGGAERVRYYEALRCAVELADVVADRKVGRTNGWEHGVPALVRHLEAITNQRLRFT